jgi:ribonucleoside-diphosphate reductase alpha chain
MVENGHIDYDRMSDCIEKAVHFLDNVIEINRYPLPVIREKSMENRKIGLGVMGFSDMLIKLGISYNSDEAVSLAEEVMFFINRRSREASARLAQKRGNFPNYGGSVYDNPETPAMRNATTTTIAPTGTISLIAGASSGIEPLFAVSHFRTVLDGKTFAEVHPLFEQMAENEEFYTEEVREKIKSKGNLADIPEIPVRLKKLFVCSHEIDCEWHIRIQAAFQKHTDNAVSKTLNLSGDADRGRVEQAFIQAYKSGCKGVTIYRYGSRERQVLTIGGNKEQPRTLAPRKRPEQTRGVTERIRTGCGNLYVTVNSDEYGICEVFAKMGKTGGCASSQIEAAGRLTSLALRSGIDPEAVVKQLIGIRCPSPSWQSGKISLSCPDAIAKVLRGMIGSSITEKKYGNDLCPECTNPMVYEEGCQICQSCGFSKCS